MFVQTVRAFFRTNRVTCEDWLTRVRLCIITTAIHNGEPALVVRQAYELLADMVDKNNTNVRNTSCQGLAAYCQHGSLDKKIVYDNLIGELFIFYSNC